MKCGEIEVYVAGYTKRFTTATSDISRHGSLEYTDQIVWLLDTYLTRKRQNNKRKVSKRYLTDEEILDKARSSRLSIY